jgi:hypothetical protein
MSIVYGKDATTEYTMQIMRKLEPRQTRAVTIAEQETNQPRTVGKMRSKMLAEQVQASAKQPTHQKPHGGHHGGAHRAGGGR